MRSVIPACRSNRAPLAICALLWLTGPVVAQPVTFESIRLVGEDTSAGDNFGHDVALNAQYAAIGAVNADNTFGPNAGALYLFDLSTGQQVFVVSPASFNDGVGDAVAIRSNRVYAGSPRDNQVSNVSGAVRTFTVPGGAPLGTLLAMGSVGGTTVGQGLGTSVAANESFLIAGAPGVSLGTGAVYIYNANNQFQRVIEASDGAAPDNFGTKVAISDDLIVVGSPFDDLEGEDNGSAYIFNASTGQELHKLVPPIPISSSSFFGLDVDIDDTTVVIGSPFEDTNAGSNAGAAYVFDALTGEFIVRMTPPDADANDRFGEGVAIDGAFILIGATVGDAGATDAGAVYVYDRASLTLIGILAASDGVVGDGLGQSLDVFGTTAIAGAQGVDADGNLSGAAYVFDLSALPPPTCPGDLNSDAIVDTADLGILLGVFGGTVPPGISADLNADGTIDTTDLGILLGQFGNDC